MLRLKRWKHDSLRRLVLLTNSGCGRLTFIQNRNADSAHAAAGRRVRRSRVLQGEIAGGVGREWAGDVVPRLVNPVVASLCRRVVAAVQNIVDLDGQLQPPAQVVVTREVDHRIAG